MQNYEPLKERHTIVAFCTEDNQHNIEGITLKVVKLKSLEAISPELIRRYWIALLHKSGYFSHMIGLEEYLRQFDIIHTSDTWFAFSHQVSTVKRHYGIKMAVTQWENIPFALERQGIIRHLKSNVRNTADVFIAVTEKAKRALLLEGVKEDKIVVQPMGVNIERFKPGNKDTVLLKALGLSDDDFIILFVGRLIRRKGIYDLVNALKILAEDTRVKGRRIKLLVVGSGMEKQCILETVQRLGLGKQVGIISGFRYRDMPAIHRIADIFTLPSTRDMNEQLGMVLVEAMASGKPIVTTRSGSISEVVGDASVVVEPDSPRLIYQALLELVLNDGLRMELSKIARKRAEEIFDAHRISQKLERILTSS